LDKEIQLCPTGEKSKSGRCHFNLCGSGRSGKSEVFPASEFKEYRKKAVILKISYCIILESYGA
jgi:hypothetical protein